MGVNAVGNNNVASLSHVRQKRIDLSKCRSELSQKISGIKNSVNDLNKYITAYNRNIVGYKSLLESLHSVSIKHGENATLRLKDDHFKYGQATNFLKNIFHGSRYQTEREAAVKKINAEGSTVSARTVTNTLQEKIDSASSKVNELGKMVAGYNIEINDIQIKKNNIEKKIGNLAQIESNAIKADEPNRKTRQNFSIIYQSNAGCKALNTEARHQFGKALLAGKVSGSKVVEEYRRVHGYEIFGRGNKEFKDTIEANCKGLKELVITGAKAWYTPAEKNIITHRGQGMTQNGIDTLISGFKADKKNNTETVYNLGQFFSTSKNEKVASHFANNSRDDAKVIFKVIGNSSNGLSVPGGLSFENDEAERLYSPLANFKVTAVNSKLNIYRVTLEEVKTVNGAPILPY